MAITYPPVLINEYLSEKVQDRIGESYGNKLLFFPSVPTDIEAINDNNPDGAADTFAIYGRMPQIRRKAFPHIKREQTIYNFFKMSNNIEQMVETTQVVYDLLDREDESAQEINEWISSKVESDNLVVFGSGKLAREFKPVFFHQLKVYQLEETQNVIFPKTTRSYSGIKMIVEYNYHTVDYT